MFTLAWATKAECSIYGKCATDSEAAGGAHSFPGGQYSLLLVEKQVTGREREYGKREGVERVGCRGRKRVS